MPNYLVEICAQRNVLEGMVQSRNNILAQLLFSTSSPHSTEKLFWRHPLLIFQALVGFKPLRDLVFSRKLQISYPESSNASFRSSFSSLLRVIVSTQKSNLQNFLCIRYSHSSSVQAVNNFFSSLLSKRTIMPTRRPFGGLVKP